MARGSCAGSMISSAAHVVVLAAGLLTALKPGAANRKVERSGVPRKAQVARAAQQDLRLGPVAVGRPLQPQLGAPGPGPAAEQARGGDGEILRRAILQQASLLLHLGQADDQRRVHAEVLDKAFLCVQAGLLVAASLLLCCCCYVAKPATPRRSPASTLDPAASCGLPPVAPAISFEPPPLVAARRSSSGNVGSTSSNGSGVKGRSSSGGFGAWALMAHRKESMASTVGSRSSVAGSVPSTAGSVRSAKSGTPKAMLKVPTEKVPAH